MNKSLRNKKFKFGKLDKTLNEYLKRDFNVELMQRTIQDIMSSFKLNGKYKNRDLNKEIVEIILKENKETETINILNKKFIDIINEIRYNEERLNDFLEKIRKKEEKNKQHNNANIEEYINLIKNLIKTFDIWFLQKFGRKSRIEQR